MKCVALIPARGGSKGIPRKNIRLLAGLPLIVWTIQIAQQSGIFSHIIVSTDDLEIANIARGAGAEVPFIRPVELAQDDTPDYPVFHHCMNWFQQSGDNPEVVVWLRPTTPLRIVDDIHGAVASLIPDADSVRSVCLVEQHPYWMKSIQQGRLVAFQEGNDEHTYPRRQLLPPLYRLNGAVEVIRVSWAMIHNRLYSDHPQAFVMPTDRSLDIDHELDFMLAEYLLEQRGL